MLDYLPNEQRDQVKSVLRAAWKLDAKADSISAASMPDSASK